MRIRLLGHAAALAGLCMLAAATTASAGPIGYQQINLASNVPLLAPNTDPNLRNPWGVSFGPSTPFWVSNQVTRVATLYNAAGAPQPLVVTIPGAGGGPGDPTGQAFVGGLGFNMKSGGTAAFVFATLEGTIDAWNGGTSAAVQVTSTAGAAYTGLAVVNSHLFAADNKNGRIDVYDSNFNPSSVSGSFVDPSLPAGFVPYNIQVINGQFYVTYNMEGSDAGYIGIFDLNGNFIRQISDSHLESPWGMTLAPMSFGQFGGDLLVGNEDEGTINAFNSITGAFVGTLSDMSGNPIVNTGLWSLAFRAPGSGFDPNALFFTAGIDEENDGLFGEIVPAAVPEPAPLVLVVFGILGLAAARWRRRS
jgi:uncharacterized protein (TIGR03118 family)